MKILKILAFCVISFNYVIASAEALVVSQSTSQRIATAHEKFQQALKKAPNESVAVAVFFTNDLALENLRMSLNYTPLKVIDFRHGTQSYSGGYTLKKGETIDQAIINYRHDHLFFIRDNLARTNKLIANETNDELRKALEVNRKQAEQMQIDYQEKGIRVIGIGLYGTAKNISDFKERNSFVHVVELKERGVPQPAIIPSKQ